MKLWQKARPQGDKATRGQGDGGTGPQGNGNGGTGVEGAVCAFTAGQDRALDRRLVRYDCLASMAHAMALGRAGLLTKAEVDGLVKELGAIVALDAKGEYSFGPDDEDCHTAIENHLTAKLGDAGKKIHAGRSRNDQVAAALRLYYKDELEAVEDLADGLSDAIRTFEEKSGAVQMPGYTHTRKAMPSTAGLWAGSFLDSIADSLLMLNLSAELVDRCPLGSAAGYGSPAELDRQYTSDLLGFAEVQENPLYVQNGRGKLEAFMLHALSQLMLDMNKLATDIILFTMPELGYFTLPDALCTGSSIMPQKKNPDVLELVRAKYHVVTSLEARVLGIAGNLLSGYNRDMQLTKGAVMEAFDTVKECLSMMALVMEGLGVDAERCGAAMTPELFAAHEAHALAKKGVPFRDAYRKVGGNYV
jgi:argininosuccinate lyase